MRRIVHLVVILFGAACTATHANDHRGQSAAENPPPPPTTPPPGEAPPPGGPPKGAMELPDKFTNLQVLPANITKEELVSAMRGMSQGLGVRCNYCHQMQPKDWAADTKKKEIARNMMRMTDRINHDLFTWPNAPRATCYMCHHGHEEPEMRAPPPPEGMPHPAPPPAPH